MATGNNEWHELGTVKGVKLGVAAAGIKRKDRPDVGVMLFDEKARVAGVLTKNAYAAPPIHLCRERLKSTSIRALVVNSGNANACTGERGMQDAKETCQKLAELATCPAEAVLPFSTGVIGEYLPLQKILTALPEAVASASENNWKAFAQAIVTTDTCLKGATETIEWEGKAVTVSGVAKGSGMINPNMATMLGYIATDAAIEENLLRALATKAADLSFNRITVDGDTSTNDACILVATGCADTPEINAVTHPLYEKVSDAVIKVHQVLARKIIEDGEGATKFVTLRVSGGMTLDECRSVAYSIAHSPLVKTAMFASDPNWGRIVMAIGNAAVNQLDVGKISVWLDDVLLVEKGGKAASYSEEKGQEVYNREKFTISVDLGRGDCEDEVWTTDFSHEYIRINAEYRT